MTPCLPVDCASHRTFGATPSRYSLACAFLVVMGVGGCVVPPHLESWVYVGDDPNFRAPIAVPATTKSFDAQVGEREAWRQRAIRAVAESKEACAARLGESTTPSRWSGYSEPFRACMTARGWVRDRSTNPL